jgi:CMP-2-keto-3-deoxyoctulosonic acid synthetase
VKKLPTATVSFASRLNTRELPAQPILDVGGRPLLAYPIAAARLCPLTEHVVVCTDSLQVVQPLEGHAIFWLDPDDRSWCPTQQIARGLGLLPAPYTDVDLIVCWHADEPEVRTYDLERLILYAAEHTPGDCDIATLAARPRAGRDFRPSQLKCVLGGIDPDQSGPVTDYTRAKRSEITSPYAAHTNVYAMQPAQLADFVELAPTVRSIAERIEQPTWLEAGLRVRALLTDHQPEPVRTPADYARFRTRYGSL